MEDIETRPPEVENPDIEEGLIILARIISRRLKVAGNIRGQMKKSDALRDPEKKDCGNE